MEGFGNFPNIPQLVKEQSLESNLSNLTPELIFQTTVPYCLSNSVAYLLGLTS